MRSRWQLGIICFGLCVSQSSYADILSLQIEPIVGYERVQQLLPTPHSVNRLIYGGRVTAGVLLVSAESEYTHGTLKEDFPDSSHTSVSDRLKLGLRSGFGLGSLIKITARGGVQASMTQLTQTVAGVSVTTFDPLRYDPYAGAEVKLSLSSKINASVGAVAIIRDINALEQSEYQATAGFALQFP